MLGTNVQFYVHNNSHQTHVGKKMGLIWYNTGQRLSRALLKVVMLILLYFPICGAYTNIYIVMLGCWRL